MESENMNGKSITEQEENKMDKSNLDIGASSIKKQTTEENKENDQSSNKEQNTNKIDITPKLRLVPLEKLLSPKLLTLHDKTTTNFLTYSNSNEVKSSSIIDLDDSEDDKIPNELTKKSKNNNKDELISSKKSNGIKNKIIKSTAKPSNGQYRSNRCPIRQVKSTAIAKIKQTLASSSSSDENDDDNVVYSIASEKKTKRDTKKINKDSDPKKISDKAASKTKLNQLAITKKKTDNISSTDADVQLNRNITKNLNPENNIVTPAPNANGKLGTLTPKLSVTENTKNGGKEKPINGNNRLLVRIKRSANLRNNNCQNDNYEITTANRAQLQSDLPCDKNLTEKYDNENNTSIANEQQINKSDADQNELLTADVTAKISKKLKNKKENITNFDESECRRTRSKNVNKYHSSNSAKIKKLIISKNKELQNQIYESDNSKHSDVDENGTKNSKLSTTTNGTLLKDCEEISNFNACENSIIDKIETTVIQQKCINNTNKNIYKKAAEMNILLNSNIKLKNFKIRVNRLSLIRMKNIIEESTKIKSDISKYKRTNSKAVRRRHIPKIRRLSSSSSLSANSTVEEEEGIKKNIGKQSSNMERDSISNDNKEDSSEDDPAIKFKYIKPKSTTIMSSSEDDIIQQDEDQSSDDDNDSNNSSELIRKRTVAVRMKKSTQRSDEEYIINSDDDDDDDDIGNNMVKKDSDNDDDYESDNKKKIKRKQIIKRKRIKSRSDSSDDDDDDEAGGSNKKRKNIRKLIRTKELNMDTKQAAQREKDRRRRIEERQRLYNSIYEKPETTELSELILDFDENTKKTLLKVDSGLLKLLKPHQATGVKFMWDACYETLKDAEESIGSGCILAHCMGLGKTLQVIALTHTLLTHSRKTNVERVLIITPLSTLTNWAREYHHWMKACKNKNIEIYDMSKYKDKTLRTYKLNEWFEDGGVCIMGYDMYRILSNEKTKGLRKKQRETLQQCLVDPGADIVICDEGHLLKNEKTSISKAVTKMRTRRRIVLTGTPLQNNLKEYYCMIQFIKPNLLGTYKEYLNRFVNPITNGQYTDSTERDIRLMKHRSHILHTLLEGCLQRRDYSVLAPYLPPKHEYVIYITLSDVQKILYEFYMTRQRNHIEDMTGKGAKLFQDFQNLRRIWTHPMCLRVNSDSAIKKRLLRDDTDSEGSLKDFIVDNTSSASSDSDSASFNSDKSIETVKNKKRIKTRNQRLNGSDDSDLEELPIVNKEDPSEWWCQMVPKEEISNINHSPKLILLMKVLDECEQIGDKLLLFSQSLQSLDVIEEFLSFINRKTQGIDIDCNVNGFTGIWRPGLDYFRLDGSSSVEQRDAMCKAFNNVNNLRARLFLISTRAGSLGINLVAANRVIIFDVSWNPSHDTQSIFRVYRFGQDKPCYIYRFIAMGTMEQKIYERQVAKQAMAKRVIDEQQIGRHYNQNDLLELYTYELESKVPREIPILPKDRLFADLLANYEKLIYKYHEHDSLLENQESDNLSEEERKAAWDEYESEKNRPPQQQYVMYNRPTYTIGPGGYQAHQGPVTSNKIFGFRTDILLRLLNMKVGRDHPRLTPNEIVQMVPSYLQQLYAEMNHNNPTMYKELLELHQQLEMPQGYYMNPLLYSNQNQMDANNRSTNPYANRPPPTISAEIVEID